VLCGEQPIGEIDLAAWSVEPTANLALTTDGELIARRVGQTTVRVTVGSQSATAEVMIIPTVASFLWEPAVKHAIVGDTIRIQAIARDEHGIITGIVPAARITGSAAPAVHLIRGGVRGTILIPHGPGVIEVVAELGRHTARTQIVVEARQP